MTKLKLIQQGAEAKIILDKAKKQIIKDRIPKSYRISELDNKIRRLRTRSEIKLLVKAGEIINVPKPITDNKPFNRISSALTTSSGVGECLRFDKFKDNNNRSWTRVGRGDGSRNKIILPFINGKKLSEHLDSFSLEKQKQILKQIGEDVAKLHDVDIIHGDLTTSNMILVHNYKPNKQINNLSKKKEVISINNKGWDAGDLDSNLGGNKRASVNQSLKLFFIDFGLGFFNGRFEDKAVDIHLLKQALEAKHYKNWEENYKSFLEGYKNSKNYEKTLNRLKKVEKRGRYRH